MASFAHQVSSLVADLLSLFSVAGSSIAFEEPPPPPLPLLVPVQLTLTDFEVAPELATVTVALPLPVAVGVSDNVTVAPDCALALVMLVGETVSAALLLLTVTLLVKLAPVTVKVRVVVLPTVAFPKLTELAESERVGVAAPPLEMVMDAPRLFIPDVESHMSLPESLLAKRIAKRGSAAKR